MDSKTPQELDLNGDVVFVLRNPNTSFPTTSDSEKPVDNEKPDDGENPGDGENQDNDENPNDERGDDASLRLRVSSKHLAMASPYFRRMFKGDWKEGNSLRTEGSVTVDVEGWDPEALLIVMNIIHGHTRQVPRQVSLGMLGQIAVIVDYYECLEIVEIFSQLWVNDLQVNKGVSTTSDADILVWILVFCVFGLAEPFQTVTDAAIRNGTGSLDAKGLPISHTVLEKIDNRRTEIISALIDLISTVFVEISVGAIETCSLQSNFAIVGILVQDLRDYNLLSLHPSSAPPSSLPSWPTPPFGGFSATKIISQLECIESPDLVSCRYTTSHSKKSCECNVQNLICPILEDHEDRIQGLRLEDFSELKDTEMFSLKILTRRR